MNCYPADVAFDGFFYHTTILNILDFPHLKFEKLSPLELLFLLWQPGLTQVRLLDVDYLVSVALNDIPESRCKES